MTLQQPAWLLLLVLLPPIWFFLRRRGHMRISDSKLVTQQRLPRILRFVPEALFGLCMMSALIALANPTVPDVPTRKTVLGRSIVLAVDISPSMGITFAGTLPEPEKELPELETKVPINNSRKPKSSVPIDPSAMKADGQLRRIDAAKRAIISFVRNRYVNKTDDSIGLVVFDERPHLSYPVTHDLRTIYRKCQFIDEAFGLGTNFGSIKPGPLDMACEEFDDPDVSQATSKVIILVTDGEDSLDGSTMARLYELLTSRNVRLYLVGVGETLARQDVDIIRLTNKVGGKVFRVENAKDMAECFATIDQLERSAMSYELVEEQKTVFFYFAWAALGLLAAGLLTEFFIINQ